MGRDARVGRTRSSRAADMYAGVSISTKEDPAERGFRAHGGAYWIQLPDSGEAGRTLVHHGKGEIDDVTNFSR